MEVARSGPPTHHRGGSPGAAAAGGGCSKPGVGQHPGEMHGEGVLRDKLCPRAAGGDTSRRSFGAVPGGAGARRCRAPREGRAKPLAAPKPRPGPAGRLLPVTLARPRLPGRPVLPAAPGPWTVSAVRGDARGRDGTGPGRASPLPAVGEGMPVPVPGVWGSRIPSQPSGCISPDRYGTLPPGAFAPPPPPSPAARDTNWYQFPFAGQMGEKPAACKLVCGV